MAIPRKSRAFGDPFLRWSAFPSDAGASVAVMIGAIAEIYHAAVQRLTPCPRLQAECDRILRDGVRHRQFQCEHLAVARRGMPRCLLLGLRGAELGVYGVLCAAVFLAHGKVWRRAGLPFPKFLAVAMEKFRHRQTLMDPDRYQFPGRNEARSRPLAAR